MVFEHDRSRKSAKVTQMFLNASLNRENILISEVSAHKEGFTESGLLKWSLYIFVRRNIIFRNICVLLQCKLIFATKIQYHRNV